MKKRSFAAGIMCIVLTVLLICSCTSVEVEEGSPDLSYDETYEMDFTGKTFALWSEWAKTQWYPEIGFTYATDMQIDRFNAMKKEFNCDMQVIYHADGTGDLMQNVAAGLPTCDIWDGHANTSAKSLSEANMLVPLKTIETMDSTDEGKWGPFSFRSYGIFNGISYGFFTWQWQYMLPTFAGTLLFNAEMRKLNGLKDPYELQENGVWNWANFEDLLESAYSSVTTEGFVPFVRNEGEYDEKTFIFSNGLKYVQREGDSLVWGFNSQFAMDAVEYLKGLSDKGLYLKGGGNDYFISGKAFFESCESHYGTYTNKEIYAPNCMEDFGFISFPYGPNGDPSTISAFVHAHRRLNYIVAYSENDIDEIGTVCDYLFTYLDGEASGWEQWSKTAIFHYEQGWENFCSMCKNINYDYSAPLSATNERVYSTLGGVLSGKTTAAEAVGSLNDLVNNDIAEHLNWIYEPGKTY